MATPDIYAAAKTNLRDNIKTLIAVFGGVAGVLLAGTPFSGFGSLEWGSTRFFVAAASLIFAVIAIALSLRRLLKVLQPDLAYASALSDDFKVEEQDKALQAELSALHKEFLARKGELLPDNVKTIDELNVLAKAAWNRFAAAQSSEEGESGKESTAQARQAFDELLEIQAKINHWAAFTRLHFRVRSGVDFALMRGLAALLFIGAFSWAVGAVKDKSPIPQVIVVGESKTVPIHPIPSIAIEPILFETGKWDLSLHAIQIIGKARDHLRANPNSGVLVYSYTDTQGGRRVNSMLATKRAESVNRALVAEGGISSARVFTTKLPETDLPELTPLETSSDANRAVQLVLIPIPKRQ